MENKILVVHLDYGDDEHGYIVYELPEDRLADAADCVETARREWNEADAGDGRTIEDFIGGTFAAAGIRTCVRGYSAVRLAC